MDNGCPSIKEDGSPFTADDFVGLTREMRTLASKLAEETDLAHYQPVYDANNKKVKAPTHDASDLTLRSVSTLMPLMLIHPHL